MRNKDTIRLKGVFELTLKGPDGKVKEHLQVENGIVLDGFKNINDLLTGLVAGNVLDYLGIGWGAGASTAFAEAQDNLQGANQERIAVVLATYIDQKNFKIDATWGPNEPGGGAPVGGFPVPIEEAAAFWNSGVAANEMFSRVVFAVVNKQAVDTLQLVYTFTLA